MLMRNILTTSVLLLLGVCFSSVILAQTFTNGSALLPSEYHSGGCIGFTDMDGDGFDDLVILDQSKILHILYQGPDGTFEDFELGSVSGSNQWGMCVADFDNDGHKDVLSGGSYDGVHVQNITAPGVFTTIELNNGSMFMQACNWADINNDGYLDVFACHDDALSRMWSGATGGTLTPAPELMPLTDYVLADYPDNDHSGNYGTVFCDVDNDGDIDFFLAKCRQYINDPYDPRRINQLWINDGNNNYSEQASDRGVAFYEQSWTVDFADIDNDGDFDCLVTTHSATLKLFENDGLGFFTEITEGSGLAVTGFFLQAKMEDFDNDGYVDLVHSGGSHRYFHNNGDKTFTEVGGVFPGEDTMHSLALGDVNRDGTIDLYASYGDSYVSPDNDYEDILWVNDGNDNNWITFELEGFQSNVDAVGASVVITGDFGTQIREIRAGESYGITCSFACHFGLGASETVETATIMWPSGLETVIDNPAINQFHVINEAPCIVEVTIYASAYGFCPGESVTLTAPEGFETYQWSNGVSGSDSIVVTQGGNYSILITNADGCAGSSNVVSVLEITGENPTIEIDGNLNLCDGSDIIMTASEASSWLWSTGEETQTIVVTSSGTFSVSTVDMCFNAGVSEEYTVVLFDSPSSAPILSASSTELNEPGSVTLEATGGENIKWFDAEFEGNLLYEGAIYTTDVLEQSTTFYASSSNVNSGEIVSGGELEPQEGGQFHSNSNRWLEFDAFEDMLLSSVTVHANGAYDRTFELIDDFDNVLQSTTVFVEDGEFVVNLNFEILQGNNYGLRSSTDDPQLWRDGTDSELLYPYALGSLGSITNCTAGPEFSYYYFFYNWQVEPLPISCESARTPITISVSGIDELIISQSLVFNPSVFPNPATSNATLNISNFPLTPCEVTLSDVQGRVVYLGHSSDVSLQDIEAGTYLLTIKGPEILGTTRVVIQ
ncbi:MAG TPA: T9SS type A sorting domain-containing protein [Flavobacteriales bacterium]|nr:T9SS type A sorting domain-containing protein [Flavobacteriales bacterium]